MLGVLWYESYWYEVFPTIMAEDGESSDAAQGPIINKVLCFIMNKWGMIDVEVLTRLSVSTYNDQEIEVAKDMIFDYLYDATAQTAFKKSRQGKYAHDQKVRNLEDIFKILEEKGDAKLTDFVALDLSKLPPITFDSIDVSVLLRKIDTLAFMVKSLEEGLGKVTNAYTGISNTVNDLMHMRSILNKKTLGGILQ